MKTKLIFTFLLLILIGCSNDDSGESTNLRFFENSIVQIPMDDTDFFVVTIDSGDNLVFQYQFVVDSEPNIADSGFSETILFEIDPSLTEFSFSDNDLLTTNAFYRQICFCDNVESITIESGNISGIRRSSNSWQIDIDVEIDLGFVSGPRNIQISGEFELES